ncbi:MAG: hypothetical protein A3F47_02465 [Candidatus Staskawiczbacteria bacterium RIFCSPHIGHO2_12_FULL_38_11]|uniref:Uncharacterized protein n=1 Tax=Candidatus Staskawiczbacteria bacterium RIFCSPHIGHO2_12_FULL_38_11 TaxID=1802209 RepID=A0A1G2I4B6_9BACT|nr:MAG: hypothetical protein A3F47_02465 [Candidatus Staskawiczbacteria bacterium RIFCSPHIGHO2_12_FULL_38_11]
MKIINDNIGVAELKEMAKSFNGVFVKAVVDVEKKIMAVDAELHMDLANLLFEQEASEPKNVWGINLYPEKTGEDFIEFDSMVNIKPGLGNKTRSVDSIEIQEKIKEVVKNLIA